MRVLLIDADSKIPNIALMRLASYYKDHHVVQLNIPYYQHKQTSTYEIDTSEFDMAFCSCVFDTTKQHIHGENIIFGGSGVNLKALPEEIEQMPLDYSIYPSNRTSYGFLTRGCIRNCKFCIVPKKEGYIHQVADIDDIVQHKQVKFLDNNILAWPGHYKIFKDLARRKIKHQFNQGLDIRLVNEENSLLLSKLNYWGEYIFALDDVRLLNIVESKLMLLDWAPSWRLKFFVYTNADMKVEDVLTRVHFLKKRKCLPYIMRDRNCWGSYLEEFYTDLSAWCNQPNLFKKMSFEEFLKNRHGGWTKRAVQSLDMYKTADSAD